MKEVVCLAQKLPQTEAVYSSQEYISIFIEEPVGKLVLIWEHETKIQNYAGMIPTGGSTCNWRVTSQHTEVTHLNTYSRSCCKKKGMLKGAVSIQASFLLSHTKWFITLCHALVSWQQQLSGFSKSGKGRPKPDPDELEQTFSQFLLLNCPYKSGASDWNLLCTK